MELPRTFVVLGEKQGPRGWCVLFLKEHAEHLADLPPADQARVFEDAVRVAGALRRVFGPVRINYECLGNLVPHVHWHVIPRHPDDPDPHKPVWGWPPHILAGAISEPDRRRLAEDIRSALLAENRGGA